MSHEKKESSTFLNLNPILHSGDFVYVFTNDFNVIDFREILFYFKESEGYTLILEKTMADQKQLTYSYIAAWITLGIHTSLELVGFTAVFSAALAKEGISCNVVAAYHHDHIFVPKLDADRAMEVLMKISSAF